MAQRRWRATCLVVAAGIVGAFFSVAPVADAAKNNCPSATVRTAIHADTPLRDWSENLAYDRDGDLWVSRGQSGQVQRYDRTGRMTASVAVKNPGAVRLGPDGHMYAVFGTTFVPGTPGGVVRIDPAANPVATPFTSGLTFPNGMAFGLDERLYVATSKGVVRVRPDGSVDRGWSSQNAISANGIAIRGQTAYVTSNTPNLGRIVAVPIDRPGDQRTLATISSPLGIVPDFVDDLVVRDDGGLLVTTLSGQIVSVVGGKTCVVARTQPVTSLAAAPDTTGVYLAGTERGDVLRITLRR